jgi:hypothetical protein
VKRLQLTTRSELRTLRDMDVFHSHRTFPHAGVSDRTIEARKTRSNDPCAHLQCEEFAGCRLTVVSSHAITVGMAKQMDSSRF